MSPDVKNDPIARQVEWGPVVEGGNNYRTHTRIDEALKIVYKPTFLALVNIIFITGFLVFFFFDLYNESASQPIDPIFKLVTACILAAYFYSLTRLFQPRIFDLDTRVYRYGWRKPEVEIYYLDNKNCINFEHIHAIQLVDEFIEDDDGDYTSTELNLVLKDHQRVNVLDHSDKASLFRDAKHLGKVLNKPVWYLSGDIFCEIPPI